MNALEHLEQLKKEGKNFFEEACAIGQVAAEKEDEGLWVVADVAALLTTTYGQQDIEKFANIVQVDPKRVYERAKTAKMFSDRDRRQSLLDAGLKYSHFLVASRIKDTAQAYEMLESAANEQWTVRELMRNIAIEKGIAFGREKIGEYTPVIARFLDPQHPTTVSIQFDALEGLLEGKEAVHDGEQLIVTLHREKAIAKEDEA